jgi:DNA-binding NtrC family response regulator
MLLVDDNQHMRVLLGEILRAIGVREIIEAGDGREALRSLRAYPIDIVMTDLAMEPVSGIEFVRLVRNSPESPRPMVPVIMITGHATLQRVAEARDAGVTEFLGKPVTARGVIDRVTRVVEHPRPFVRSPTYFGPDRRRRDDPHHRGPFRRASDEGKVTVVDS